MIDSTARIHPEAQVGENVSIGAYAVIDGPAIVGSGSKLYPHAYLSGWTRLGERCEVYPFAVIGADPQDLKFEACDSYVEVGDDTALREFVTIHRGSHQGAVTRIGRHCLLMAKSHIGHDCTLGDGVVVANTSEIAGHVSIGDDAYISGHALIHQFTRIGRRAMVAPLARIRHDIPPFLMTDYSGSVARVNLVGLRREKVSPEAINEIKAVFKLLYRSDKPFRVALEELMHGQHCAEARALLDFVSADSKCGVSGPGGATISRAERHKE